MRCTCNAAFCGPGQGHEPTCGVETCPSCGELGHTARSCRWVGHCCGAVHRCPNCPVQEVRDVA